MCKRESIFSFSALMIGIALIASGCATKGDLDAVTQAVYGKTQQTDLSIADLRGRYEELEREKIEIKKNIDLAKREASDLGADNSGKIASLKERFIAVENEQSLYKSKLDELEMRVIKLTEAEGKKTDIETNRIILLNQSQLEFNSNNEKIRQNDKKERGKYNARATERPLSN